MNKRELGNFERAQVWVSEVFPFSAVTVLRITNGPTEETLSGALVQLQQRHPLLRSHIRQEGVGKKKRYFFEFENTPPVPLTVMKRESETQWRRVSEGLLDLSVDLFTGPMVRVIYLRGDNLSEIIIMFQHLIMDATSGGNLLHELLSLCSGASLSGVRADEPGVRADVPHPATRDRLPASFRGFSGKRRIFSFLGRQMADEIAFMWRSRGIRKAPVFLEGKNKILTFSLGEALTAALIKRARKKRVTINDLSNAVIMMAVQKHLYKGIAMPMRHFNFADLRPYLDPPVDPHILGSYFAIMRFTVGMEENPNPWELARKVGKVTYRSLKRGDKFCANILSPLIVKSMLASKSSRMSATALSFTGTVTLDAQYGGAGGINVKEVHALVSNYGLGPEYTAQVRFFNHCFCWDILYLDCDMDEAQAETIKNEIHTILERAAAEEEI